MSDRSALMDHALNDEHPPEFVQARADSPTLGHENLRVIVKTLDISTKPGGSPVSQDRKCHQGPCRVHLVLEGLPDQVLQALADEEPPKRIEVAFIGEVAVDSGQLMVTDPCYIDQEWKRERFVVARDSEATDDSLYNYSYDGACNSTLNGKGHGQLAFPLGHAGAGVAFQTAWGDGSYAVFAEKHDGRIVRVYVNVG